MAAMDFRRGPGGMLRKVALVDFIAILVIAAICYRAGIRTLFSNADLLTKNCPDRCCKNGSQYHAGMARNRERVQVFIAGIIAAAMTMSVGYLLFLISL